jgi:hypothetical protein
MLTTGFIFETHFIAKSFNTSISGELGFDDESYFLKFKITPDGWLDVWYCQSAVFDKKTQHIWRENFLDDSAMLLESMDSLSRAVTCLNNGSDNWKNYVYIQK